MRILTYNVSWQSMVGNAGWKLCDNNIDPNNDKYYMKCIQNVSEVIDANSPYDFVLLQEASNFELIITQSKYLKTMSYSRHKSGLEEMIIFWDKSKYQLESSLVGEFSIGRPYQILTFDCDLTIINIHASHQHVKVLIKKLTEIIEGVSHLSRRFIIGGDFNNEITSTLQLGPITFYSENILTCCGPSDPKLSFDHILDSMSLPIKTFIPIVSKLSSDHKPVIAILNSTQRGEKGGQSDLFYKYLKYKILYLESISRSG